jgi:predicted O-methyltransferase YrrM
MADQERRESPQSGAGAPPGRLGGARDSSSLAREGYTTDVKDLERWGLAAALAELDRTRESVAYLEIGVMGGGTIKFLRERLPRVRYTGIDLFEDFEPSGENTHISPTFTLADVQRAHGPGVRFIKGSSVIVLKSLRAEGAQYDMIFIDANHTYAAVKADFESAMPLLIAGGFIAFHNASVGIKPDYKYVLRDGGPWKLTQELRRNPAYFLEIEVERLRVFRHTPAKAC